jgi:DNA repair protein RecN (Recombination protein N)
MLTRLTIRDIVLIDQLDLPCATGLSVLTGETGAGKSILLDAFALALGGRGDGSLVRHGQTQGQVTAVFDLSLDHPAAQFVKDADISIEGDLILRRIQMADGRTKALINDQSVSVQMLKAVGALLVEIHGQHDDRALMETGTHRAILDAFGGLDGDVKALQETSRDLKAAQKALAQHQAKLEEGRREQDFLTHAVEELTKLCPQQGEELQLTERRQVMQQAQKVVTELQDAYNSIAGQSSPTPFITAAIRRLARRQEQASQLVDPSVKALDTVLIAIDEARHTLESVLQDAQFNPYELEEVEERLFALRDAARKFNVSADELAALVERYQEQLSALSHDETTLTVLQKHVADLEQNYIHQADRLSEARKAIATHLDVAVNNELPPLKLERARFMTSLTRDEASRDDTGFDRVEFHVQTNLGTRAGPMMKVASGGELSRFLLALKVVLADKASAPTLIFDEIDTGVGGAVADAIGQRLARLASKVQVLCVTHAPQVAAQANTHFLIRKDMHADSERIVTSVRALEHAQRREEIARMLAGERISDAARAAADHLLQGVR